MKTFAGLLVLVISMLVPILAPAMLAQGQTRRYELSWVEPQLPSVPSARCCAALAYDKAAQSMLLFGGGNGGISPYVRYGDTWIWKNGWFQLSPTTSPSARQASATAYDPTTGTVVLFGGADINNTLLAETWTWDGVTWTQQSPQVSPPARACATQSMTYDAATGSVVLFGCRWPSRGYLGVERASEDLGPAISRVQPKSAPSAVGV
jgi:hypothetical protein